MLKTLKFSSLVFILTLSQLATAGSSDPLWAKVVTHYKQIKKWAAKDIEQSVIGTKSDEAPKTVLIKKQFSGWENNKAQYTVISTEPPASKEKTKKPFDVEEFLEEPMKGVFTPTYKVKRTDQVMLNNQTFVMYEASDTGWKLKLWVNPQTGTITKRNIDIYMPLMMEGKMSMDYADQGNIYLPYQSETFFNVLVPFKKAKIEIKEKFTNWAEQK